MQIYKNIFFFKHNGLVVQLVSHYSMLLKAGQNRAQASEGTSCTKEKGHENIS